MMFVGLPDRVKPKEVGRGTTGGTGLGVLSVGAPGELTHHRSEIVTLAAAADTVAARELPQQDRDHDRHHSLPLSPCPSALRGGADKVEERTTSARTPCLAGSGLESDLRLKF